MPFTGLCEIPECDRLTVHGTYHVNHLTQNILEVNSLLALHSDILHRVYGIRERKRETERERQRERERERERERKKERGKERKIHTERERLREREMKNLILPKYSLI